MQTFYLDKKDTFKCSLTVEGASISDSKVRLRLDSDGHSVLYEGKLHSNGACEIPIPKLNKLFEEEQEGQAILEVIVDDTYMTPWEDEFTIGRAKKVTVEVADNTQSVKEKMIEVKVETRPRTLNTKDVKRIAAVLKENKITSVNIKKKSKTAGNLIYDYLQENKITDADKITLTKKVIELL